MFTQKKILPPGIDEHDVEATFMPDVMKWHAPFDSVSIDPDWFSGLQAQWDVRDANGEAIAAFDCRQAACAFVHIMNRRHQHEIGDVPVVHVAFATLDPIPQD